MAQSRPLRSRGLTRSACGRSTDAHARGARVSHRRTGHRLRPHGLRRPLFAGDVMLLVIGILFAVDGIAVEGSLMATVFHGYSSVATRRSPARSAHGPGKVGSCT